MKTELTVVYVGANGNSNLGKYFYSYDPEILLVEECECPLTFTLSEATLPHYEIIDIFFSGSGKQFKDVKVSEDKRSISFVDINTKKQLISLSILVKDTKLGNLINCDPQVMNKPPN
ncbi:MAG: hypothetical protein HUJ16_01385 [Kangiella sp.]|nr:hypothetical protein [Kangiella sp.]